MKTSSTAQGSNSEYCRSVKILNRYGLHGRPTTIFVKLASQYRSAIRLTCDRDDSEVDGKSAISILSLGLEFGRTLHIHAIGDDAADAVDALARLVRSKFQEE